MTLDEAIKRLEQHKCYLESIGAIEQVEAHQLGIEALRHYRLFRGADVDGKLIRLPGETK